MTSPARAAGGRRGKPAGSRRTQRAQRARGGGVSSRRRCRPGRDRARARAFRPVRGGCREPSWQPRRNRDSTTPTTPIRTRCSPRSTCLRSATGREIPGDGRHGRSRRRTARPSMPRSAACARAGGIDRLYLLGDVLRACGSGIRRGRAPLRRHRCTAGRAGAASLRAAYRARQGFALHAHGARGGRLLVGKGSSPPQATLAGVLTRAPAPRELVNGSES